MNETELTTVLSDQVFWFKILLAMDWGLELSQSVLERLEKLNLSPNYFQELIDNAAKQGYNQVYLIALKKKEKLNGFNLIDIKENFEL